MAKRNPNFLCLPGDPWTIGIGATGRNIGPALVWTLEQVWARFESDLRTVEKQVRFAVRVPLNENQFSALVSFTFNIGIGNLLNGDETGGPSDILAKLNAGDYLGAAAEFPRWIRSKGVVMPGLISRREEEQALFVTPMAAAQRVG